jgi:hypothetical protein
MMWPRSSVVDRALATLRVRGGGHTPMWPHADVATRHRAAEEIGMESTELRAWVQEGSPRMPLFVPGPSRVLPTISTERAPSS